MQMEGPSPGLARLRYPAAQHMRWRASATGAKGSRRWRSQHTYRIAPREFYAPVGDRRGASQARFDVRVTRELLREALFYQADLPQARWHG